MGHLFVSVNLKEYLNTTMCGVLRTSANTLVIRRVGPGKAFGCDFTSLPEACAVFDGLGNTVILQDMVNKLK